MGDRKKAGKAEEMSRFLAGSAGQATARAKPCMRSIAAALVLGEKRMVAWLPIALAGPAKEEGAGQQDVLQTHDVGNRMA